LQVEVREKNFTFVTRVVSQVSKRRQLKLFKRNQEMSEKHLCLA